MKIPADVPYMGHPQTALGALIDLTAKITATEPEPVTASSQSRSRPTPARRGPVAAAMTDHIQNNPFGRSTDGHRDDWSVVQIGGTVRAFAAQVSAGA